MTFKPLDVVALTRDIAGHGLRTGDLGAVVDVRGPGDIAVEFIAASGRTQALVTLVPADVREVTDDDLVSVRPVTRPQLPLLPVPPLE